MPMRKTTTRPDAHAISGGARMGFSLSRRTPDHRRRMVTLVLPRSLPDDLPQTSCLPAIAAIANPSAPQTSDSRATESDKRSIRTRRYC